MLEESATDSTLRLGCLKNRWPWEEKLGRGKEMMYPQKEKKKRRRS